MVYPDCRTDGEVQGEEMKTGAKGRHLRILALALLLAAVVLFFRPLLALHSARCVVRVSFTGLENMFHSRYEYYALEGSGAVRLPGFLVKAAMGTQAEEKMIYDDTGTAYWFVTLQYGKEELTADSKPHLETSFGPDYWLLYDGWTRSTPEPGKKELDLMLRAAEALHDGNLENWNWQGGGAIGLTSFMLIRHGDQYLVEEADEQLLRPAEDGSLEWLMDCPRNGQFDCWFFR